MQFKYLYTLPGKKGNLDLNKQIMKRIGSLFQWLMCFWHVKCFEKKSILEINGNKCCDVAQSWWNNATKRKQRYQAKDSPMKNEKNEKKCIYWFIFILFYLLIYLLFIFLDKQGKINPSTSQR